MFQKQVKQKGDTYTVIAVMKRVNLVQKVCRLLHSDDSQAAIAFSKHVEVVEGRGVCRVRAEEVQGWW